MTSKAYKVVFDEAARRQLFELRVAVGARDNAEVLKRALGLYDWAIGEIFAGRRVGSFAEGEPVKEVLLVEEAPK